MKVSSGELDNDSQLDEVRSSDWHNQRLTLKKIGRLACVAHWPNVWQAPDSVGRLTCKIVPEMTYDLSGRTLIITTLVLYHTVSHFVCSHILNIHGESWKSNINFG